MRGGRRELTEEPFGDGWCQVRSGSVGVERALKGLAS